MADRPLLHVVWQDSEADVRWRYLRASDTYAPLVVDTVGWQLHRDDDLLVLASTISRPDEDGDRQACGTVRIPMRSVVEMREVQAA